MKTRLFVLAIWGVFVCLPSIAQSAEELGDYYGRKIDGVLYSLSRTAKTAFVRKNGRNASVSYSGDIVIPSSVVFDGITFDVTGIDNEVFYGNSKVTSVTIPNSLKWIGSKALSIDGAKIYVKDLSAWCRISFRSYDANPMNCADVYIGGQKLPDQLIIPNDITSIGSYTFVGCSDLKLVSIPNSVTEIGEGSFMNCTGLREINIPNGMTTIEKDVFKNCTGLTSVIIPDYVTSIGISAFSGCTSLKTIDIPNSVTVIETSAFYGCTSAMSLTIPDNLTKLGNYAFGNCSSLTSVSIPDNIETIPYGLFEDCKGLTSVEIPNGVTNISNDAFQRCSGLVSVILGSSVKTINSSAFAGCVGLKSFTSKAKYVPKASTAAFLNSSAGSSTLHVPETLIKEYEYSEPWNGFNSITAIPNYTYSLIYRIDEEEYKSYRINIGNSITPEDEPTKEGYTFSGWSDIPETMPNHDVTVTGSFSINKYKITYIVDGEEYKSYVLEYGSNIPADYPLKKGMTFSGWNGLPETMPAKDLSVSGTFSWSRVTKDDVIYQVTDTIFNYCSAMGNNNASGEVKIETSVSFDNSYTVTSITDKAFNGKMSITTIIIPPSITTIGERAFANIDKMTDVTCLAAEIPETDRTAFENSYIEDYVTLHVPEGSLEKYKTTAPWKNFKEIVSIKEDETPPEKDKCAAPTISVIDDKLTFSCETKGVTYHYNVSCSYENSGEGDCVELHAVYKVSVFASKNDYANSDTVTKEIAIDSTPASEKIGDINGDGIINAADIVTIVNKIVQGEKP